MIAINNYISYFRIFSRQSLFIAYDNDSIASQLFFVYQFLLFF